MNQSMPSRRTTLLAAACASALTAPAFAWQAAATAAPAAAEAAPEPGFWEALTTGSVKLDLRLRAESADQDGLRASEAFTARTRLGYLTRPWNGFHAYVEMEDVRTPDDDTYNSTLNSNPGRTVIADPEGTELNEAWLGYEAHDAKHLRAKFGRQTLTLDDHRFLGDVGWRQDNQTFDALSLRSGLGVEQLQATYGYLGQVNRIFAQEADWDSDSHVFNVRYAGSGAWNVVGFAYLLDFEESSPANSSQTYGARLTGSASLGEHTALEYAASVAAQSDHGDNPVSYDAPYYALDLGLKVDAVGVFGAGYEVLGSDDGAKGFATPLATLHKFNGYADKFLNTPADGLRDLYVFARGLKLPGELTGYVAYHDFQADDGGADYGQELDVHVTRKINDHVSVGAKYAQFWGDSAGFDDTAKFILDLTVVF